MFEKSLMMMMMMMKGFLFYAVLTPEVLYRFWKKTQSTLAFAKSKIKQSVPKC